MLLNIVSLIIGFIILIYGANFLVDGGSALAHRLKVSPMVIGLTVIAFGTSAPEFVVNIVSSVKDSSALALGNVMGSNIFNILAILGITALITPICINKTTTRIEIPLTILAAILVLIFVNGRPSDIITRTEGIYLLCLFAMFLLYTFVLAKYGVTSNGNEVEIKNRTAGKSLLLIALGLTGLIAGGRLLVTGAVHIAQSSGIPERIIALTIISIGTSLPELATSIIAACKKNAGIAIGNVIGSNLFNTFLILGSSATISPIEVPPGSSIDMWTNITSSILLFIFIFTGKDRKINRWEGGILFACYIGYLFLILNKST